MYNSYTVSALSKLWRTIGDYYNYSVIKRINDTIIQALRSTSSSSYIVRFITSEKSLIENSMLYNVYRKAICLLESLSDKLRSVIKQYKEGSVLSKASSSLFESTSAAIGTISLIIIAFSVVNIVIDAVNNNIKTYGNIVLFIITILFLLVYKYKENSKGTVENSLFIKLLKDIFTIDDGGDQWW